MLLLVTGNNFMHFWHTVTMRNIFTYLLITIGGMPILFCAITLFMPLRATILAFIIGSVIASKSKEQTHFKVTYFSVLCSSDTNK